MMPGMPAPMQPHAPTGPSPLVALLMHHAQSGGGAPQMPHPGGMPQAPGAPMPLNAGGHPAGRFGHAPSAIPGM